MWKIVKMMLRGVWDLEHTHVRSMMDKALDSGNPQIVELFIQHSSWEKFLLEGLRCNKQVSSMMDKALDSGNPQIVELFIQHSSWEEFLLVELRCNPETPYVTPMRRLIKEMPEMARLVMDKCWKSHNKQLIAHFELVDDMYGWVGTNLCSKYDDAARTYSNSKNRYSEDKALLKRNHPLKMIADTNATYLMCHPLVMALLRRKWHLALAVYISFLLYYMTFIIFFTASMMMSRPLSGDLPCDNRTIIDNSTRMEFKSTLSSHSAIRVTTIMFAVLGLIMECIQLFLIKCKDYINFHNLLDWFTYIGSIVLLSSISTCGRLIDWQWQFGVACLFLSYMNMIFFLRIIPHLGIYVLMVVQMLRNFLNFFVIMFLFLLAFGICFNLLTQNQVVFSTVPYSVMKSVNMMLGDIDFAGIFLEHIDNDEPSAQLHYMALMWILYFAFLVFMTLVILNLLTSLSVSGVESLQKDSKYKTLALQINIALDVEFAIPPLLHRKLNCCVRFQEFQTSGSKRSAVSRMTHKLKKVLFGSLSKDDILKQAQTVLDYNRTNEDTEVLTVKDVDCIVRKTSEISSKIEKEIEKTVEQLKSKVDSRLDNVEKNMEELKSKVDSKLDNVERTVEQLKSKMDSKLDNITQILEGMVDRESEVVRGSEVET